jgi:hypothetical protein
MRWPARKFEAFYSAFIKRQLVEELRERKEKIAAALYANTNWDGKENSPKRDNMIKSLQEQLQSEIEIIYGDGPESQDEIDWEDPFWSAVPRSSDEDVQAEAQRYQEGVEQGVEVEIDQA